MDAWKEFTDKEMAAAALTYWANSIETGEMTLSAKDAEAQGKPFNALSVDQMALIIRLRKLARKLARKR
jgi:hypothetical protein